MINYWVSSVIWLSLERYYNAGLNPDEVKDIIESMNLGFGRMRVERQYINNNWNVKVLTTNPYEIEIIVDMIEFKLNKLLESKGTE